MSRLGSLFPDILLRPEHMAIRSHSTNKPSHPNSTVCQDPAPTLIDPHCLLYPRSPTLPAITPRTYRRPLLPLPICTCSNLRRTTSSPISPPTSSIPHPHPQPMSKTLHPYPKPNIPRPNFVRSLRPHQWIRRPITLPAPLDEPEDNLLYHFAA